MIGAAWNAAGMDRRRKIRCTQDEKGDEKERHGEMAR